MMRDSEAMDICSTGVGGLVEVPSLSLQPCICPENSQHKALPRQGNRPHFRGSLLTQQFWPAYIVSYYFCPPLYR